MNLKKKMRPILILVSLLIILQEVPVRGSDVTPVISSRADTNWVDSVFNSLSADQRICQLLMIRAFSDRDSLYNDSLTHLIRSWNVGGICFFKGTPYHQAELTNRWQKAAATPLLIAIDAEWGLGTRLDSAFSFPKQMTLGAIRDDSLIYQMAVLIAKDCKRLGIQMNFAPVVDVNNNPSNPVIGFRSFGEDRTDVARKGVAYMKGLQDEGIFATAKHFPGHGNTDADSHMTLPVVLQSKEQMDSLELFPFKELISNGLDGIMVGHLFVPAYDSSTNMATSLSSKVVDGLLKKKLGFKGWVITDALDMNGVTIFFKPGVIEVKALEAGNDILLLPEDLVAAVKGMKQACDSSLAFRETLNEKCKKVLFLKYKLGLTGLQPVSTAHLYEDLHSVNSVILNEKLYRSAITLVKNEDGIIPLTSLDNRKIAALSIGNENPTVFQEILSKYAPIKNFNIPANFSRTEMDSTIRMLSKSDLVIIGIHCQSSYPTHKYGFPELASSLIDSLCESKKIILVILGSPYVLSFLKNTRNIQAILVSYMNTPVAEDASAQIIFGGIPASGRLPVSGSSEFALHSGESTESTRLKFIQPEEIGISSEKLKIIDSLAILGIEKKAYPGCQIVFVKDGKVFYEKSFGNPGYEETIPVTNKDIYDLASLTKVIATTPAIMKLYEQGKLSLEGKLGTYLDEVKGSNKENITIREIMTHQAGLQSWIRFYDGTLINGQPDPSIYHREPSQEFPLRVANGLYMRKSYEDTLYKEIIRSPVLSVHDYKYSDLGFYLLRRIIEKLSGKRFEEYLYTEFFHPLGLTTTCFHPRDFFPVERIMPTEYDTVFRKQQIRGDVHDPGAAMLGGVSGHAGLFSNAADLAVILQLLLNGGSYGGKQYFLPSTIKEFTKVQFPKSGNRRALGFDKPMFNYSPDGPVCLSASPFSFGHSGFTGTYCWVDPSNNLIYIFLSNRVYPDASNQRISTMNIRTLIHQVMYDILSPSKK